MCRKWYVNGMKKVCKLKKALNGLKQAARCWYEMFEKVLKEMGFAIQKESHEISADCELSHGKRRKNDYQHYHNITDN